jgi:hypothetical protein
MVALAPELEDLMLRSTGRTGAFSRRGRLGGAALAMGLAFAAPPAAAQAGTTLSWGSERDIAALERVTHDASPLNGNRPACKASRKIDGHIVEIEVNWPNPLLLAPLTPASSRCR